MASNLPPSGVSLIAQNAGQFVNAMSGAERALGSFGKGAGAMGEIVTGALRRVGEFVVDMAGQAARAVGTWLKDSIGVAGDFEQTLNVLGATSGATAADLEQVAKKAKELGADMTLPATSAQDAAEVMLELSKAGFSVQESMDAAKGALQLSAAAQIDAATAASITANAINAFGLEAADAVRVADLLAAGANASSASMTDLSQGLQQAGFAFNAAGLPIEDLITSLAALTNVGLTGSDSGTALKNALMRLMDPTDKAAGLMKKLGFSAYDAQGQMKPLPTLIADLNKSLAGMTDEERNAALGNIFLSDGMKAMIPLLDLGADGFLKLKGAVTEQGAAADVANAQMKGWNGGMQAIGSQMETLQLTIGTLLKDALTPLLFKVAEFIPRITAFVERMAALGQEVGKSGEPFKFLMTALALLNPSLIGVVTLLLRLHSAIMPMVAALQGTAGGGEKLTTVLTTLLGPLGATEGAIKTGAGALEQIWAAAKRVSDILSGEFTGSSEAARGVLAGVVNTILATVLPAVAQMATWLANNLPAAISTAKAAFADVGAFITSLMPTLESIVTTALTIITTFWNQHGTDILFIVTSAYSGIKGLIEIVLGAIQGILAVVLAAMTGDWESQMGTIQSSNERIWHGIRGFLEGILNVIAGFFGTSLAGIGKTWTDNFTMMGMIANTLMGQAQTAISTKVSEIRAKIGEVIGQAVALWDEHFGHLFGTVDQIMAAAAAIVSNNVNSIRSSFSGIVGAIDSVISAVGALIDSFSNIHVPDILTPGSPTPFEIGLRGVADALALVADWSKLAGDALKKAFANISNSFSWAAAIPRAQDEMDAFIRDLTSMKGLDIDFLLAGGGEVVQALGGDVATQFQQALADAEKLRALGPEGAAQADRFLQERIKQIKELARLQLELRTTTDATRRAEIEKSIERVSSAQINELMALLAGIPGIEALFPQLTGRARGGSVQRNKPYKVGEEGPELFVPGRSGRIMTAQETARAMIRGHTPSAANVLAAPPPPTVVVQAPQTNTTTYQMPIYTNQSPAVLSQGLALIGASL